MAIYQFICKACGHKFECFERITEAPKATDLACPKCKGEVEQSWEGGSMVWNFKERFR